MNNLLNQQWKKNEGLFRANIIDAAMEYPYDLQTDLLVYLYNFLEEHDFLDEIFYIEDWHEHDGFITEEKAISKSGLLEHLNTAEQRFLKMDWHHVSEIIYSSNFILRYSYDFDSGDEEDKYANIQFSIYDNDLLEKVRRHLSYLIGDANNEVFTITGTKNFFDKIYGG